MARKDKPGAIYRADKREGEQIVRDLLRQDARRQGKTIKSMNVTAKKIRKGPNRGLYRITGTATYRE